MKSYGKVYIVGAGCGSYDLITLRGLRLLKKCDVLIYDSLIDPALVSFAENAEKIFVGKRSGMHSESQENINLLLVKKANEGKMIVRLKGGDPFVFGRGSEEAGFLQKSGVAFSIVPGVTSAVAAAELAGIPVTHRNLSRSFHVITGHTAQELSERDMSVYAKLDGTLVFLMGLNKTEEICESLVGCGKPENTPTAIISNGGGASQKVIRATLKTAADRVRKENIISPAVIVVGDTAKLNFLSDINEPLEGTSVTVTGTLGFALGLSKKLEALGACTDISVNIKTAEYKENKALEIAIKNISQYKTVVFTSPNGVKIFFKALKRLKTDIRCLYGIEFAAIGSATADALEERGIYPEIVPQVYTSQELGKLLSLKYSGEKKLLLCLSEQASPKLAKTLDSACIPYDNISLYRVEAVQTGSKSLITTDFITFASASSVSAFFAGRCEISEKTTPVCIGEIAAQELKKHVSSPFITAKTANSDGILNAILTEVKAYEKI